MDFAQFVQSRSDALVRLAYLLTGNRHQAEDLAQEALLKAHRHWRRVRSADDPDAYVRKILVNQYVSWRRRRSSSETPLATVRDRPTEEDIAGRQADRDLVWRALHTIPDRQRAVLVLRHYEHLTDRQIGTLLGCADGTVRSLASRAAATLRANSDLAERQEQP